MMREDNAGSHAPSRKPIILIGAPSGAGKTVLSEQIIAGALPFFTELCGGRRNEEPVRHDIKLLPDDPPRNQVLVIECATHKFEKLTRTEHWRRMLAIARESEQVICVNLDVPHRTVVWQYCVRIFTGPKRMHVLYRVLQLSKYRNTLIYLLTRQLSRADAAWRQFGRELAQELAPRVVTVTAQRQGSDYRLALENSGRPILAASSQRERTHAIAAPIGGAKRLPPPPVLARG